MPYPLFSVNSRIARTGAPRRERGWISPRQRTLLRFALSASNVFENGARINHRDLVVRRNTALA